MQQVSTEEITNFIKLLMELGGSFLVAPDYTILNPSDSKPKMVTIGKKDVPLKIFNPSMQIEESKILNPFVESTTDSYERAWFWNSRSDIMSLITKYIAIKIAELAASKPEEIDMNNVELLHEFVDKVDDKTSKQIEQIPSDAWLTMVYHRKNRTCYAVSKLFDDEFRKELDKKVNKKTWAFIDLLYEVIFKTTDLQSLYKFTSDKVGMIETESRLAVLVMLCDALHPYASVLLKVDLHPGELHDGLDKLEMYRKTCLWFTSSSAKQSSADTKVDQSVPPWQRHSGGTIPTVAPKVPMPQAGIPIVTTPSSLPQNPHIVGAPIMIPSTPQYIVPTAPPPGRLIETNPIQNLSIFGNMPTMNMGMGYMMQPQPQVFGMAAAPTRWI